MRHKIAHRKLNRTAEHRKALIKNMLNSLIKHEQIETTLPKAKELKVAIDKISTYELVKDFVVAEKRELTLKGKRDKFIAWQVDSLNTKGKQKIPEAVAKAAAKH